MTPEDALKLFINLINDDRLRFLNRREFTLFDQAIKILEEKINENHTGEVNK